jgi:hypothetical protein
MLIAEARSDDRRRQCAGQIVTLREEIRARPEAVEESLRRLGTTLTAARLEFLSLKCLVSTVRPDDPVFLQRAAFDDRQA